MLCHPGAIHPAVRIYVQIYEEIAAIMNDRRNRNAFYCLLSVYFIGRVNHLLIGFSEAEFHFTGIVRKRMYYFYTT